MRRWQLTEAGHARFPDRHAELTLDLIEGVRALFGEAGLEKLIVAREESSERAYRSRVDPTTTLEADIAAGKATRGNSDNPSSVDQSPLLIIQSGSAPPSDAYAAVTYKGRWFWIADNDIRSKSIFSSVMLLFSISEVGIKSAAPVVTVPAN